MQNALYKQLKASLVISLYRKLIELMKQSLSDYLPYVYLAKFSRVLANRLDRLFEQGHSTRATSSTFKLFGSGLANGRPINFIGSYSWRSETQLYMIDMAIDICSYIFVWSICFSKYVLVPMVNRYVFFAKHI